MAETTEISWTDGTWNPWWGCSKIAPACDHCYAADLDKRTGGDHWGNVPRRRTSPKNWNEPIRWQKKAAEFFSEHGRKRRVFVASMSDFYDNQVDPQWRADAWEVIRQCPDIDWLILTKRPQNIRKMLPAFWDEIKDRIWSGTTIEDMERAEKNIRHLLEIDSRFRFLSCEPLLGPLELRFVPWRNHMWLDALEGVIFTYGDGDPVRHVLDGTGKIDWVIAGGESGHGARPMHIGWLDQIEYDCRKTGTAFHFKQWGNHIPAWMETDPKILEKQFLVGPFGHTGQDGKNGGPPPHYVVRTSKKVAGEFRGKQYKAFPA